MYIDSNHKCVQLSLDLSETSSELCKCCVIWLSFNSTDLDDLPHSGYLYIDMGKTFQRHQMGIGNLGTSVVWIKPGMGWTWDHEVCLDMLSMLSILKGISIY